jgi:gamma-glutamyl-gamma-aminobutyrate hydrolase PuuD
LQTELCLFLGAFNSDMTNILSSKRIAITQRILEYNGFKYDAIGQDWYSWLGKHRITSIKNHFYQDFDEIVDSHDIIIFSGGNTDKTRTFVEMMLYEKAVAKNKPIIGVCHGFNFLTHIMGGAVKPINNHHNTTHNVIDSITKNQHNVNSFHSYCVDKIPNDVTILATDLDGNCESFIKGNVCGVMWHPERLPYTWLPESITQILK